MKEVVRLSFLTEGFVVVTGSREMEARPTRLKTPQIIHHNLSQSHSVD